MTTTNPSCALYVHVPFCRTLCGYCDFYSEVLNPGAVPALVDALLVDLRRWAASRELRFDTVFVGGGTPTVLPPAELRRLLGGLRSYIAFTSELEFTVEANPATVTDEVAGLLAEAGVNRVSIGAQSFDPAELRVLDRRHQPEQVAETLAICRRFGIAHQSLDLIFGVPWQTVAAWQRNLEAALALQPEHLSCYGLTYESGTPLFQRRAAGQVQPVDEDVEAEMFELTGRLLPARGWRQYEISNFAQPGRECRHNLRYWHNEPYVGIGPAAAGFIDGTRYKNVADTAAYVHAVAQGESPWCEHEQLSPERRRRETAMLELRLIEGIHRPRFCQRYGVDPVEFFADVTAQHVADGLLEVTPTAIRLTRAGLLLADTVIADFL